MKPRSHKQPRQVLIHQFASLLVTLFFTMVVIAALFYVPLSLIGPEPFDITIGALELLRWENSDRGYGLLLNPIGLGIASVGFSAGFLVIFQLIRHFWKDVRNG